MNAEKNPSTARSFSIRMLALASVVALAGCSSSELVYDDYIASSVDERYPIKVAEAPVKMNISAKAGTLRADDMNRVIGFAQDARNNATSTVAVQYASGSAHARRVAQEAVAVLTEQGVPRSMIRTGSYKGSSAVVTLSFHRKVAVTKECGDWSEDLSGNTENTTYPNHGCAIRQNMAAMVSNPDDFEGPRPMSPAMAASRSAAIKKYNAGEAFAPTSSDSNSSSSSSSSSSSGN